MSDKQWVQHISGEGEKWEIKDVADLKGGYSVFEVKPKSEGNWAPMLPKSEYRLCSPPEVWVDVTEEVEVVDRGEYSNLVYRGDIVKIGKGPYRLRKITIYAGNADHPQAAFIVERKEQP